MVEKLTPNPLAVALFAPQIPQNTGSIIRLCANLSVELYLIEPLGFSLDSAALKRAGLDYHEWVNIQCVESFEGLLSVIGSRRLLAVSTHGAQRYSDWNYEPGDVLLFGSETSGLPVHIREQQVHGCLRLPMQPHSRSLNLANSVAVVAYEAARQMDFWGLK